MAFICGASCFCYLIYPTLFSCNHHHCPSLMPQAMGVGKVWQWPRSNVPKLAKTLSRRRVNTAATASSRSNKQDGRTGQEIFSHIEASSDGSALTLPLEVPPLAAAVIDRSENAALRGENPDLVSISAKGAVEVALRRASVSTSAQAHQFRDSFVAASEPEEMAVGERRHWQPAGKKWLQNSKKVTRNKDKDVSVTCNCVSAMSDYSALTSLYWKIQRGRLQYT